MNARPNYGTARVSLPGRNLEHPTLNIPQLYRARIPALGRSSAIHRLCRSLADARVATGLRFGTGREPRSCSASGFGYRISCKDGACESKASNSRALWLTDSLGLTGGLLSG